MAEFAVEFEFIEDDSGGQFVASGGNGFQQVARLAARGDIDAATRMYEDSAHTRRHELLQEAKVSSVATRRALVEVFKRARDFAAAAELSENLGAWADAAALWEKADQFERAPALWVKAGDIQRAGAALERLGRAEEALELYRKAGNRESEARCLAHLGRPMEAAKAYRALGNTHAELEQLLAVPASDPQRRDAVLRACELLDEAGHPKKALALLGAEMKASTKLRADFACQSEVVRLLRRCGRPEDAERALKMLQGQVQSAAAPVATAPAPQNAAPSDGYGYLKAIPLFAELGLPDMKDLFRLARRISAPAGVTLIHKGARNDGLVVLLRGEVEVYSGPDPDARLLNTLGPGAYLGEISLLQDQPASAHVKTKTQVEALRISRDHFQSFLDTHQASALKVWRLFAASLAERVRALSA